MILFLLLLMWTFCLLLTIGMSIFLLLFIVTLMRSRVPFVPARSWVLEQLPKLVSLPAGSHFYDLGAGDGRIVYAMARAFPESRCTGLEIGPYPWVLAQLRSLYRPLQNAQVRYGNFMRRSFRDATHVYMYLFPRVIEEVFPKLLQELPAGSLIISCDYPYSKQTPVQVVPLKGKGPLCHTLYFYTVSK